MRHVMVGATRIRLSYDDQNEGFAQSLPRDATVVATPTTADGIAWALLALDAPVSETSDGPDGSVTLTTSHVLIRSRWVGQVVGGAAPTSVFILLVAREQLPVPAVIEPSQYLHVAWGMASTL